MGRPKSMQDIRNRYDELFKQKKGTGNTYDILVNISQQIEKELVDYYSTSEGRAEIDDSPHAGLETREAVALLMGDVDQWAVRTLREQV